MAGREIPFKWITALPHQAQYEIWRDFEDIIDQLGTGSASVYDAIIDPTLSASDPTTHQYKNLTDLVANETWSGTTVFSVGVHQNFNTAITEPAAPLDISSKGDLALHGIGGPHTAGLPWAWQPLIMALGQQLTLTGLAIQSNTISAQAVADQGIVLAFDSEFYNLINGLSGRSSTAWSCIFDRSLTLSSSGGVGVTYSFYNCKGVGFAQTTSLVTTYWLGGALTGTVSATNDCFIVAATNGGGATWTFSGGNIDITNTAATAQVTLSISAGVAGRVHGQFIGLTWAGTAAKIFRGVMSGSPLDVTGPATLDWQQNASSAGIGCHLRGDGISATVEMHIGRLSCETLTNSQIRATWSTANGSTLALDASSNKNLIILSGSNDGSFGGVTNLGTNNRIITETSDSFLTSATVVNLLRGPTGPPGEDGADGEQGPPGPVNEQPWFTAWGPLAPPAQATSNQGSITGAVDITGVTVTVTPRPNRYVRVTITGVTVASTAGTVSGWESALLKDGSTVAIRTGGGFNLPATSASLPDITFIDTPTGTSHTYKLQCLVTAGGGTMTTVASSSFPIQILVEDAGPVA